MKVPSVRIRWFGVPARALHFDQEKQQQEHTHHTIMRSGKIEEDARNLNVVESPLQDSPWAFQDL